MASLGDVSRYLRQRRAIGKPITDRDRSAAWNAYFDTEASKQIQRGQLALDTRKVDIYEKSTADQLAMQREAADAAEKSAMVSGISQLGQLGSLAYKGSQTALGQKAIAGTKSLLGMGKTTGAQGAVAGAQGVFAAQIAPNTIGAGYTAVTGAGPAASTTGTAGLGSVMGPVGWGSAAGGMASNLAKRSSTVQDAMETVSFGVLHAEKDQGFVAGVGAGAAAGAAVGGPIGAVIGGIIGGVTSLLGTWVCTKIKDTVGVTEYEWETIRQFRLYAKENYSDWLEWYVDIGPRLLEAIDGDEEFYLELKHSFLLPIIGLTAGGYLEAAALAYKSTVIQLVNEYKPELMATAPEVI